MLTTQDERMLSRMGITTQDPHASCKARLAEEQRRTDVEQLTAQQAWRALEKIRDSRDFWRKLGYIFSILSIAMAIYIELHSTY
jgi:hypothetical protein